MEPPQVPEDVLQFCMFQDTTNPPAPNRFFNTGIAPGLIWYPVNRQERCSSQPICRGSPEGVFQKYRLVQARVPGMLRTGEK